MNNKAAKKLRRLSVFIAAGNGKTLDDAKRIYTIDYKIRNYFINNLINQLQKNIRDSKF